MSRYLAWILRLLQVYGWACARFFCRGVFLKKVRVRLLDSMFHGLVLLAVFFIHPFAGAFLPEYQHLTQSEQNELNSPRLIDSEYQSDKLSYELPLNWHYDWLSQDKIFQYSAGSLGPTRFLTRGRGRLREQLSRHFYFQLSYLDYGDFEWDRRALVFEFAYQVQPWLSLSVYGQPSTLKKEDDVGVALEWRSKTQHRVRLFYTAVDFSHNKRNEQTDRYKEKPTSAGLVWRWFSKNPEREFLEASFRKDSETSRVDPDLPQIYSYSGTFLDIKQGLLVSDNFDYLQWHLQASKSFEGDTLNTDFGVERWDTRRLRLLVQVQNDNQFVSLYGIKNVHLHWQSAQGHVLHNSTLPFFWIPFYRSQSEGVDHQWLAGLEATWHRGRGPRSLRGLNDFDNRVESRLNGRYQLNISNKASLTVLLSLDLDSLDTAPWEGGNMQYTMLF